MSEIVPWGLYYCKTCGLILNEYKAKKHIEETNHELEDIYFVKEGVSCESK